MTQDKESVKPVIDDAAANFIPSITAATAAINMMKHDVKFNREIMPVQTAQALVLERVQRGFIECVPLEQAYGRHLAEEAVSNRPVPHFRRSIMDGYAVIAMDTSRTDTSNPIMLQVIGEVPCGSVWNGELRQGQAIRIMTGAQVPDGADAVVRLEWTTTVESTAVCDDSNDEIYEVLARPGDADGDVSCSTLPMSEVAQHVQSRQVIAVHQAVKSGEAIHGIGTEMQAGEVLVQRGQRIGAGEMGLLAMFGYAHVQVFRRPQVAILSTGEELLSLDEELTPGKIYNSNSYILLAQIESAGAIPHLLPHIPDDIRTLRERLDEAMEQYDVVITTGGVSVGDYDLLYEYTTNWDGDLLFNKVKMRPGSPTTVGFRHSKPLFALAGNPAACYVGCELFVRPTLLRMQGVEEPLPKPITAVLTEAYRVRDTFDRYVRAVLTITDEGHAEVRPTRADISSATVSIRDANCLFLSPASQVGMEAGALVQVFPLGGLQELK
ncbi:gephyrin-like molybdotransferase Glp [Paenibacillus arenosi]|uniref:Molybdopterin molybdenumtransferase n=1 Tax=Paenibacillus arenosi TaxID=2774142 RepID=A0ABR9AWZ5_9BACL|nr:gephyrin-like molybdotransferase Glp [Paenibacillus arenosi]MBD8498618.1 molybdopterin molybdotransferase MoeA [Paenibacillus arenosi]